MPEHSSISNSKNKNLKILLLSVKLLFFVVPLILFVIFLGKLYEEKAGLNKVNEWNRQRFEDFYALEANSLDILFLGSSHSYCTFDPENFDSTLNTNSFQLGMPSQFPDMTYYTLVEALNYQKPSVVVMELYWSVLNRDFEVKQVDTTFQFMRNEDLKSDFYKKGFPINEKAKYSVKSIRFQQDFLTYANKRLNDFFASQFGLKRTITQFEGEEYYRSKGYIYCDYVMTNEQWETEEKSAETDGRSWDFSPTQKEYLEKIVKLCSENNIKLIFVTAPVSNISYEKINRYETIHEKLAAFAQEQGIKYLDFNIVNAEKGIFSDDHFRDARHLNVKGAKIADQYFINEFRDVLSAASYVQLK